MSRRRRARRPARRSRPGSPCSRATRARRRARAAPPARRRTTRIRYGRLTRGTRSTGSATTCTSTPRVARSTRSIVEGRSRARSPLRRPAPSTSCVTPCASTSRTISAAASSPARRRKVPPSERVSASAPSSTSRVPASMRPSCGSTTSTSSSASARRASRAPSRIRRALEAGRPPIETSTRSSAWAPSPCRASAAATSAISCNAIARSAERFAGVKKPASACSTRSGGYTSPRAIRSRSACGLRSIRRISSAPCTTPSGTVSRTSTPVSASTRSCRLSRCWTFTVVQTSMPCAQQVLDVVGSAGAARSRRAFVCASSSMQATAGRRSTIQSMSGSVAARPPRAPRTSGAVSMPARALLGALAAVRLEIADHEVDALGDREPCVAEHLVRLAHARGRAQVDAQLAARDPCHVHGASVRGAHGLARPSLRVP